MLLGFRQALASYAAAARFCAFPFTIDSSISIVPPEHTATPEGPRVPAGGEALGYLSLIASRQ